MTRWQLGSKSNRSCQPSQFSMLVRRQIFFVQKAQLQSKYLNVKPRCQIQIMSIRKWNGPDYHNFNHQYQTPPLIHLFQCFHKAIRISETLLSVVIIHYWDRNYLTKYFSISDFKACSSSNIQDSVDHTLAEAVNCLLNFFLESIFNKTSLWSSHCFQLILEILSLELMKVFSVTLWRSCFKVEMSK